jgi:hypothetical protein
MYVKNTYHSHNWAAEEAFPDIVGIDLVVEPQEMQAHLHCIAAV